MSQQQQAQQQFADFATDQVETALRFARVTIDSLERVTKLNLDAAKNALEENAKNAKILASVKDAQEALSVRQHLAETSVEQFSAYTKSLYDITSQAQAELAKLVEERTTNFNKDVVSGLDRFVKSAPAGTDVAVAAVKSTVQATAAAVDSLTKAAKQVADFADASVKAATTATTDAVKAAAKKGANAAAA
ncbi:phasin family protein [Chitiniphilus eburneus]|uniref:Phasin family protein n=1 Tax=Chitiniphilus eburneus TaxID=2571148 RepID=A0A4U0PXK1_9NEIS|nr:phasin family protein [Chitiniphilus eburneus]TJZ73279.1 phasin family protein [Chitiniphilus eburneus]